MSYIGWTVQDWIKFHFENTPNESFALLVELVKSQSTEDPAWISLADEESLTHQWKFLQSK